MPEGADILLCYHAQNRHWESSASDGGKSGDGSREDTSKPMIFITQQIFQMGTVVPEWLRI